MGKTTFGPRTWTYPMPVFLIGANVEGKANFMTAAWGGIVNAEPPMIAIPVRRIRHTLKGINQMKTFTVNIPSVKQVKEADYCGIASGGKEDKVKACKFTVFYGKLGTAPLIEECPVNLECKVAHTIELGSHILFIGTIEETYFSDECLTDGKPDPGKIKPFLYITEPERQYHAVGEMLGKAYHAGLGLKGEK